MHRARAIPVLVALTLMSAASCGDGNGTSDSTPMTTEASTPAASEDANGADIGCDPSESVEPGSYEQRHTLDGVEQPYWLVVPETYEPGVPTDLYIVVPGGSGSAQAALTGWGPTLVGVDALVVFADVAKSETKTVPMIRALIDDVADGHCVDHSRVYATGTSSGAGFTGRLMAEASDVIAAFAPGIGMFAPAGLEPIGPVPFIAWSGETDRATVERSVAAWADSNGCDTEPILSDLGSGIVHHHYEGCDAPTEYYFFAGMGHQVPSHDCTAAGPQYCAEYEEFDFWADAGKFFDANPAPTP